ncbi:MAG: ATP-binding protein [Anaerolineales bacterium]
MAKDTSPTNPISRLFKVDPYRELFLSLADTLDNSVLVISGTESRLLTCNHEFLLLSGYARKDLDDLSPSDLFPGEEGHVMLERILNSWENPDCVLQDVPLQTRTGEVILIDLEAHPIAPPRTAVLLQIKPASARSRIEERKLAEETLLRSLENITNLIIAGGASTLPTALELCLDPLYASYTAIYRLSAASPDYFIEGVLPPEFPETFPAAAIGNLQVFTSWSLGQRPEGELQRAARTAELSHLKTALIGDDSAWIGILIVGWKEEIDLSPDIDPLIRIIANLLHTSIYLSQMRTTLVEGDTSMNTLEAEITSQFEAIADALITVDSSLTVTRANSAINRLLGYRPSEVYGLAIQDVLVGPEDVTTTILDALGHKRTAERSRLILHHRDGTRLPVHLRVVPMTGAAEDQLLIVLSDQSAQQAIEDQTEILAQRALLGEVTAIFAHEVRNPINNISTGVQLVASRLGESHPQFESLGLIRAECVRLDQLMSDVLFFARPLQLKMDTLNLAELLQRVIARWGPRFNQTGTHCHTSFHPDTPLASADPRTLERVIVNLISNALEAMTEGGTLSINIAPIGPAQDGMIELKVADTGPGIPSDKIHRIFDPFFTTKKDGTGLGLAISRRIITAHKGTIQVESFPDAGTVFTIHLPSADLNSKE